MKKIICLFILIIFLIFMYAKYIEPYTLVVKEYSITNSKIPNSFNGFKIAHLSDILYSEKNNLGLIEKTITETNSLKADIIVYTGDISAKPLSDTEKKDIIQLLKSLQPTLYKYAILGDKDNSQAKEILESSGFIILDNTSSYIFNEGSEPILIAGGNNLTEEVLLNDENINYNYKIALIHKPDNFDNIKNHFNLVLAGHSLGGHVRIPFVGATTHKTGASKYTDRHYKNNDSDLYTSFGIGTEHLRLFNKPSINVYRLYSK